MSHLSKTAAALGGAGTVTLGTLYGMSLTKSSENPDHTNTIHTLNTQLTNKDVEVKAAIEAKNKAERDLVTERESTKVYRESAERKQTELSKIKVEKAEADKKIEALAQQIANNDLLNRYLNNDHRCIGFANSSVSPHYFRINCDIKDGKFRNGYYTYYGEEEFELVRNTYNWRITQNTFDDHKYKVD